MGAPRSQSHAPSVRHSAQVAPYNVLSKAPTGSPKPSHPTHCSILASQVRDALAESTSVLIFITSEAGAVGAVNVALDSHCCSAHVRCPLPFALRVLPPQWWGRPMGLTFGRGGSIPPAATNPRPSLFCPFPAFKPAPLA